MGTSVSVIIPTKDRPDDILRCLDSILIQSHLPDEIIIVDASQTIELSEYLNGWGGKQRVGLSHIRSKPGLPYQRNLGISKALGQIIFFFDDDIVLEPNYIEEIVKIFEADSAGEIGGVMGDIYEERKARQTWPWWHNLLRRLFFLSHFGYGQFLLSGNVTWPWGLDEVCRTEFLCGGQVAYRRSVFDKVLFGEDLKGYASGMGRYEDVDFSYRESRLYQNIYTPAARCWHLQSSVVRKTRSQLKELQLENFSYLFRKNLPQTWRHKVAFRLALVGFRIVPRIEYYVWRIGKAIKGELPWTKREPESQKG